MRLLAYIHFFVDDNARLHHAEIAENAVATQQLLLLLFDLIVIEHTGHALGGVRSST